ncbi:MAG: hypothetical protein HY217_07840, partial [Candidatus Rokubacteria bacterium]|nr:hypothetical protein [Candidatus Rokubacteria bacterium]
EASRKAADEIVGAAAEQLAHSSYAASHREMLHWNSPFNRRRLTAVLADPDRLVRAVSQASRHYRVARNRRWLERHLTRTLPAAPYVMYALQHTPEAGICSQAPRWVRQEAVIEQLAISAPAGVRVVAKEHPRTFGSRGASFFSPLTDLPNVVTCHPTVSTEALLHGADGVVAVTGSPGFEALILGKRVGVLGRPFYAAYKGVRLLDHPADVYAALADRAWRPDTMVEERREFLAAYVQSLFDFGHGDGPRLYPASGGERWAAALRDVHGFVRVHGLRPADFESGL